MNIVTYFTMELSGLVHEYRDILQWSCLVWFMNIVTYFTMELSGLVHEYRDIFYNGAVWSGS